MESTRTELRPPRLKEVLDRYSSNDNSKEITINPAGGFFDAKDLPSALRKLGSARRLLIPPGEHPAGEITKSIQMRGSGAAPAIIKGTLTVKSEHTAVSALELQASAPDQPAVEVKSGSVFLDGCVVRGGIKAEPGTSVFLRNCIVIGGEEAISANQASIEIMSCRITGAQIGLALREKSVGAVYHSHISHCRTTHESDWGAGVLARESEVYCEGVTFSENGVGIYLTGCRSVRVFSTIFLSQQAASLISAGSEESQIHLRSCVIEGQTLSSSPQINVTGGKLDVAHVEIRSAEVAAIAASQTAVTISDVQLVAEKESALELQGGSIQANRLTAEARQGAGCRANGCSGGISDSAFIGRPPVYFENSPEPILTDCGTTEYNPETTITASVVSGSNTDILIKDIVSKISQENVRTEMERILRLAHASRERNLSGLPLAEQSFHAIFTGSPDTGKFDAARTMARGLHSFGMTMQPDAELVDMSLLLGSGVNGHAAPEQELPAGATYLITMPKTGFNKELREIRRILEKLVASPGTIIILDGQRDEMRFLIRSSPILERAFRHALHFPDHGPIELMSIFTQLCEKDSIALKPETAMGALLLFHAVCDRKDRRLTTTEGVEAMYDAARQRYLERCSRYNRFDLPMEIQDLDIMHEKAMRFALDRNPAFSSFCPQCAKENPWVLGLGNRTTCFHCDTVYEARWGLWRDSVSYRRLKDTLSNTPQTGGRAMRKFVFSND